MLVAASLPMRSFATTRFERVRVDAIDANYAEMSVRDCVAKKDPHRYACDGTSFQVKVNDLALRASIKEFHVGDQIRININEKSELEDVRGFWAIDSIKPGWRVLTLILSALVTLGFATLVTKGAPLKLIVGQDNRYSNSKFQVAMWFWVLISSYLAIVVSRGLYAGWDFFGRVNIPQNLLFLSGISALTFGGAKAITTAKMNAAAVPVSVVVSEAADRAGQPVANTIAAVGVNPVSQKTSQEPGKETFFKDLLQNDIGQFDFGDFQMLVVTLLAVGMYIMLFFHCLGSVQFQSTTSLPDLDSTVLASFGLGQGAYLTKKAAGNAGTS
jgi:hypothetical protein